MKLIRKKILSLVLIVVYALSTLGFVVDLNSCECCEINCSSEEILVEETANCCSVKPEAKSCCADTDSYHSSNCMCEQIKCDKSDYLKNDHKTVVQSLKLSSMNVKNYHIETIKLTDQEERSEEIIKFLKADPPPVLFKDASYIIELSRLKLPASNLI